MLRATEFEFRHRFWIIGVFFWAGFALYGVDRVNVVQFLIDRTVGHEAPTADLVARLAFVVASAVMLAAALIRTWAAAYLRTTVVQDPTLRAEKVVADGPYRLVRNPLYLGTILIGASFAFMASRLGAAVIVIGLTLFTLRLIGLEEWKLESEKGERYRKFCKAVPRLLPSLAPRLPASGLEPQWRQAFLGEIFVWGFFLGVVAFTITFRVWVTWVLVGLALGLYIVRSYMMYGKGKPTQTP